MEPFKCSMVSKPCSLCSTTDGEGIDLGIDYSPEIEHIRLGAVTICDNCFELIADSMGYAPVGPPVKVIGLSETDKERIEDAIFTLGAIISDNSGTDSNSSTVEEAETSGHDTFTGQSSSAFSLSGPGGLSGDTSDESVQDDLFSVLDD